MITITSEQIERVTLILGTVPNGVVNAFYSAIGRARTNVRETTTKGIGEVYAISKKDIRAETNIHMWMQKTKDEIVGNVSFTGCAIPLYRFNVSPKQPKYKTQAKAAVLRSSTRTTLTNAFVAEMKSGHPGVFMRIPGKYIERRGNKNMHSEMIGKVGREKDYDQFYGSSTATMAWNSIILEDVERKAQETIDKRLEHEIKRILNGYGVKK